MSYEIIRERRFNPILAGVMSFFIPGLGQFYKGHRWSALLWLILTLVGYRYLLLFPGLILHFFCVVSAVLGSARRDYIRVP
jgi:TM2 domain-containing membrane protein YozV